MSDRQDIDPSQDEPAAPALSNDSFRAFLSPGIEKSIRDIHQAALPDMSMVSDAINASEITSSLQSTIDRMTSSAFGFSQFEPLTTIADVPTLDFTPDDSPRRTAEHTAATAKSVEGLLEITNLLAALTEANINASKASEKRNFALSVAALVASIASAGAAIASVFLFLGTNA